MKHDNNKKSSEKIRSRIKISLERPLFCKICNKEIKSESGLASHIKNQHNNLSYYEYLKTQYNIDIKELNREWDNGRNDRKEKSISGIKKYTEKIKGIPIRERLSKESFDKFTKSMKKVNTLNWFIEKYGEEMGRIKYKERSIKISKTSYFKKYNKENKENWSKLSQILFWEIYNIIGKDFKKIYFGELNHECSGGTKYNFDFVILDNKKIIEFNGDQFHANPKIYDENDIPLKFLGKTAKEIWISDEEKIKAAKNKGFDIKTIWERDLLKNKEKTVLECIKFIKE